VSVPSGHPSLRARISEALDQHLLNASAREIGARLGHAGTTISRRGGDLRQWPADELLHLATKVPEIGEAVREFLSGAEVSGDARRVDQSVLHGLAALGQTIATMAEAMANGHCDVREAARLLPLVQQAQVQLAQAAKDLAEQVRRGAA
jgi:hypothetical protein